MADLKEYIRRLQARLTEIAAGRELEAIACGKPVPESVREIRALVTEHGEGGGGGEDVPAEVHPLEAPWEDKGELPGAGERISLEVLRGLRALVCGPTFLQADHQDERIAVEWLCSVNDEGELSERITGEGLRGLYAMACALTVPQAAHPDVQAACEWLRTVAQNGAWFHRQEAHDKHSGARGRPCAPTVPLRSGARRRRVGRDKTKRPQAWWDEHTVVLLGVTHLNEHGARVLFAMPGRGIYLSAETPEQAAHNLAYARERWPEGVYEVREARFWRDVYGSCDPVHTLIADTSGDSHE